MFELRHTPPECAGRWERIEAAGRVTWRCSRCGAVHRDGVAVRFAVLREYDLELLIARLAREGRRLPENPGQSREAP